MKKRKLLSLLLVFVMLFVTACSGKEEITETETSSENQRVILGTVAGQSIYLDEAKVYLRAQQLNYEQLYKELGEELTDDMWENTIESTGKTLGETVKDEAMSIMIQTKIILAHAEENGIELSYEEEDDISRRATSFMENTSKAFISASGATQTAMNQIYTENLIIDKVYTKITESVTLTEEEASLRQINIKYIDISLTDGQTPISVNDAKAAAEAVQARVGEGLSIDDAAAEAGYELKSASISTDGTDNEVKETAVALKTGEMGIATTDTTVYLIYCENENDTEVIEQRLAAIIENKQYTAFYDAYTTWAESAERDINTTLWNGIKMDFVLTLQIEKETGSSSGISLSDPIFNIGETEPAEIVTDVILEIPQESTLETSAGETIDGETINEEITIEETTANAEESATEDTGASTQE